MTQLLHNITAKWALAGGLLLIAIMGITSLHASSFILNMIANAWGWHIMGIFGYEDITSLFIGCALAMFFPYAQTQQQHIYININLPPLTRYVIDVTTMIALLIIIASLSYWVFIGMIEHMADNSLSPVIGWYIWPCYGIMFLSLILWLLVSATQLYMMQYSVQKHG